MPGDSHGGDVDNIDAYLSQQRVAATLAASYRLGMGARRYFELLSSDGGGLARWGSVGVIDMIVGHPLIVYALAIAVSRGYGTTPILIRIGVIHLVAAVLLSTGISACQTRAFIHSDTRAFFSVASLAVAAIASILAVVIVTHDVWAIVISVLVIAIASVVLLFMYIISVTWIVSLFLSVVLAPTWIVWWLIFVIKDWFALHPASRRIPGNAFSMAVKDVSKVAHSRAFLFVLAAPLGTTLFATSLSQFVSSVQSTRLALCVVVVWLLLVAVIDRVAVGVASEIWAASIATVERAFSSRDTTVIASFILDALPVASEAAAARSVQEYRPWPNDYVQESRLTQLLARQLSSRAAAMIAMTSTIVGVASAVMTFGILGMGSASSLEERFLEIALQSSIVATCTALGLALALLSNQFLKPALISVFENKAINWRAALIVRELRVMRGRLISSLSAERIDRG